MLEERKMDAPEYSIIIPIYNSEKYLARCISSVLEQSFDSFELLLVDDGSTDGSAVLCEQFKKNDARVKLICKENGGVSSARNKALEQARGRYIIFIDSDDFVEKEMLTVFNKYEADLVLTGFSDFADGKITKILVDDSEEWRIGTDDDIIKFLRTKGSVFVWGKKYKKEIIDKYHLRFRNDMKYSEDVIFNNEYILHTKSIINIEWSSYFHCQYKIDTLSSSGKYDSFSKRNRWRAIAYKQYQDYETVQEIYAKQMLYYAEKEISSLCKKKGKFIEIVKKVKEIIEDDFFQYCIEKYSDLIPMKTLFLYRHKMVKILILTVFLKG